jgi:hypothetical protein
MSKKDYFKKFDNAEHWVVTENDDVVEREGELSFAHQKLYNH